MWRDWPEGVRDRFAGMYDWTATLRKRIAVIRAASALRAAPPRGGQDRDGTGGAGWITAFAPSTPDRLRKQIDLEPCFRRASRQECAFRQPAHESDVLLTGYQSTAWDRSCVAQARYHEIVIAVISLATAPPISGAFHLNGI
jgi:hypothetical protein